MELPVEPLDGESMTVACRHNGKGAIDQIRVNWKNLIVKIKNVKTRVQADPSAAAAMDSTLESPSDATQDVGGAASVSANAPEEASGPKRPHKMPAGSSSRSSGLGKKGQSHHSQPSRQPFHRKGSGPPKSFCGPACKCRPPRPPWCHNLSWHKKEVRRCHWDQQSPGSCRYRDACWFSHEAPKLSRSQKRRKQRADASQRARDAASSSAPRSSAPPSADSAFRSSASGTYVCRLCQGTAGEAR